MLSRKHLRHNFVPKLIVLFDVHTFLCMFIIFSTSVSALSLLVMAYQILVVCMYVCIYFCCKVSNFLLLLCYVYIFCANVKVCRFQLILLISITLFFFFFFLSENFPN